MLFVNNKNTRKAMAFIITLASPTVSSEHRI